jgi:CheY-like chemotaxis protein
MALEQVAAPTAIAVKDVQHTGFARLCEELEVGAELARVLAVGAAREVQMDARRQVQGMQRAQQVALACVTRRALAPGNDTFLPRVIVVHRHPWMRRRFAQALSGQGLSVIAEAEDGATALGLVAVEQPDLLVLEQHLPWMTTLEVVRIAHLAAPQTFLAVQLEEPGGRDALLAAGAGLLFDRVVPVVDACEDMLGALQRSGRAG